MKPKRLLSCLLFLLFIQFSKAQPKQPEPALQLRLQKYAADNHLYPGGTYMYFDTITKKPYRFSPNNGMAEDVSQPLVTPSVMASPSGTTGNVLGGGNFHLVKDIDTATDASIGVNNVLGFYPSFAILNNTSYFVANDGIHGLELWKSDGTAEGTLLVKDINAGENSSAIYNLTAVGTNIYFSLHTSNSQYELWKTDGTEAGTMKVTTLISIQNAPPYFCGVDSILYFTISSKYTSDQLWKSDGTEAGTAIIKDFSKEGGINNYLVRNLVSSNGLLLFVGVTIANGAEMWRSDGTDTGTYMLKNISPFTDYFTAPGQLTPYNNKVYFSEIDSTYHNKLWVTDGTSNGTMVVPGYNNVFIYNFEFTSLFDSEPFVISNNELYCKGTSDTLNVGAELFRYNIANPTGGLALVKDITPNGNTPINRKQIVDVNGTVYFTFQDDSGWHLYKTNGTETTTFKIKDIPEATRISWLTNGNGKLYFFEEDSVHGYEPWISDGTTEGTTILKDIYPGSFTSSPYYLTACNGKILFSATDDLHGNELWASDGINTQIVKEINTTTTSGSYPSDYSFLGNKVLFAAHTYATGDELWRSDDGSNAVLAKDIRPGQSTGYDEYSNRQIIKNNSLYFIGNYSSFTSNQGGGTVSGVFKSDGTTNGTILLSPGTGRVEDFAVTDDNTVFYIFFNYENFLYELWKTNGTSSGTTLLHSGLTFDFSNSFLKRIIVSVGNTVYFSAKDKAEAYGFELWKSDGAETSTIMVKDINTATDANSNPARLIAFNNQLFFAAYDGNETALWTTDGTEAGTFKVKSVLPYSYAISGNLLFFSGATNDAGTELWKSNGTAAGTIMVKDIYVGMGSSSPNNLININGILYFTALDNSSGNELWKSDGTAEGTIMVKDITPGVGNSSLFSFTTAANKLFFTLNYKIWVSDGTEDGTGEIVDESLNGIKAYELAGNGNQLYVTGYTYKYGSELYIGDVTQDVLPVALLSFTASLQNKDVIAQWQTISEVNTAYFNLQRSTDAVHFTNVGKVTTKGNSNALQQYSFPDLNIATLTSVKTIYYRLQTMDKDGSSSLSKIIPVDLKWKDVAVLLHPNPANDYVLITGLSISTRTTITITDELGKTIAAYNSYNAAQYRVDVSRLIAGVYYVQVKTIGKTETLKFVKE